MDLWYNFNDPYFLSRLKEAVMDLLLVNNDYVFDKFISLESHKQVRVCLLDAILNGKSHSKD